MHEERIDVAEPEQTKDTASAVVERGGPSTGLQLFQSKEVKGFIQEGLRKFNTLPDEVELELTFADNKLALSKYEYLSRTGASGLRDTATISAEIKYCPAASHLMMGIEYPLALSRNALLGLMNYLKASGDSGHLKGRTFRVFNKNRQTYIWKEITTANTPSNVTSSQNLGV